MAGRKQSKVLAVDLAIWPMLRGQGEISDSMYGSPEHWSAVATYLLLHDVLVVPAGNYQVLPVLRLMLGDDVFGELLRDGSIRFLRYDTWVGFTSGGLCYFSVVDEPGKPDNLFNSFFLPQDEAIAVALRNTNPSTGDAGKRVLTELLNQGTTGVQLTKLVSDLNAEVQMDFRKSHYLRDSMTPRNRNRPINGLRGLPGDKVVVYSPHMVREDAPRDAWTVLEVAFENLVLAMGGVAEVTDVAGSEGTLDLVRAKGRRMRAAGENRQAFAEMQRLEGLPDLGRAFHSKDLTPRQLLSLRRSREGEYLRAWFAECKPGETGEEVVRKFVDAIGRPTWLGTLPVRIVRFVASAIWGAVHPQSALIVSAVDALLLPRLFPGRSPRLFMDRVKALRLEKQSARS